MARSKGVTISVKVPINWDAMTGRTRQRLRQTVGRDTRVIRAYLGIIEQHEDDLLTGRKRDRIDDTELSKMTMTSHKVKSGDEQRSSVPHDFKVRFPRISQNEMADCRKTAVALYESYLRLRGNRRRVSRPSSINSSKRIPRWTFTRVFKIVRKKTTVSKWWLDLRDSFDSSRERKSIHNRILIPLKISPFHLTQIEGGEVTALQLFTDKSGKWWATFAIRLATIDVQDDGLPFAVLGIDLGIEKAACSSLLTPEKTRETRYFMQKDKVKIIKKYDGLVADLQREMNFRRNRGLPYDKIVDKLRLLSSKRENVAKEYDRVLVHQIREYITELSRKYELYVAIGRLKNIRMRAKRGNYQGPKFRGMIHSWAYSRITNSLKHGLAQQGWRVDGKDARFRAVPEAWTSIICWKCGSKGIRPNQNYFHCPSCGLKLNADRNGSINIAARMLTLTKSLYSVRGLGLWTRAIVRGTTNRRSQLKAQKKKSSYGKSLLSNVESTSDSGESAAVHSVQMDPASFSDESSGSDYDPAVVKTVETLSVIGSDEPMSKQEKEVRSSGGILSR